MTELLQKISTADAADAGPSKSLSNDSSATERHGLSRNTAKHMLHIMLDTRPHSVAVIKLPTAY